MAKGTTFHEELKKLEDYLKSNANEDAKRPLLYPLFSKLFKEKFKIESAAAGADVYIEGVLLVESKTDASQWLEGFYQALHYSRKYGLAYNTIMVIANNFCAIWRLDKLPEYAVLLSKTIDPTKAPNVVGKENAKKTAKHHKIEIQNRARYWVIPKDFEADAFSGGKSYTIECHQILKELRNLDADRSQINRHNFIMQIERMKAYFEHPIDAIHAFYAIIPYWDITSRLAESENGEIRVVGYSGTKFSDAIEIPHRHVREFKRFVEHQYIFTNEGSGLTVDYYFSRFDEVLATVDPEYVKQHGIFFTDANLSRYALWFAKHHFPGNINEDYIVFDPAGGSGNLVSSWRGKLKHKIISELQPDLLRIIERRMKADPFHIDTGFTIIPKTSEGVGLNFLDRPAGEYMAEIEKELQQKHVKIDKPIAFLLNPPYKNTDENVKAREEKEAHYEIDKSIMQLTGKDAGNERYLAFLGQILNICQWQHERNNELKPVVMIFTPTSWLIPRPTYQGFRGMWDRHFKYHSGFIITSNEFFKLQGKWPLAFTIWMYEPDDTRGNHVQMYDLTGLKHSDLDIDWLENDEKIDKVAETYTKNKTPIIFDKSRGSIKEVINQKMFDFKRDRTKAELASNEICGGMPLKDNRRNNKKTYGLHNGNFIGFMDDATPVRIQQDSSSRMSNTPDRLWLQLRPTIIDINLTKVLGGSPDKYGYCAYDIESAKLTFTWFCITKSINGVYPVWANQFDIWPPIIKPELATYWHSLCYAFVLAENRCVVTKFPANDPVEGAPEVFVDNPMSPNNRNSFWSTTLDKEIVNEPGTAKKLVEAVKELYRMWNHTYCKGQTLEHVGLQNEAYFKYFDYADFVTPNSGLIQIRKYAEVNEATDLVQQFAEISACTKLVKAELYRLLVDEFKYFE